MKNSGKRLFWPAGILMIILIPLVTNLAQNKSVLTEPQNVSLRTALNRLNVQQNSRVACALNGSRFTYFADLEDNLLDASLIIGNSVDNLSWQIYQGIGADPSPSNPFGFLYALSDISSDSTSFPPGTGYRSAWGKGTNRDSTVAFDVKWYAPKHPDSSDFYVGHFSMYKGPNDPTGTISNLTIAYAADWDIKSDTAGDFRNTAGTDSYLQLLWQRGAWTYPNNNRFGGIAVRRDDGIVIPGGFVWSSDISLTPNGGNYRADSLWNRLETTNGLHAPSTTKNFNSVIIIYRDATINGMINDSLKFSVILAAQRVSSSSGLEGTVRKAQAFTCAYVAANPFCNRFCGDVNGNGSWDSFSEGIYILDYICGGPPPPSIMDANIDGECDVNIGDAVRILGQPFGCEIWDFWCADTVTCTYNLSPSDTVIVGCPPYYQFPGTDTIIIPIYMSSTTGSIKGYSVGLERVSTGVQFTSALVNTGSGFSKAKVYSHPTKDTVIACWSRSTTCIPPVLGIRQLILNIHAELKGATAYTPVTLQPIFVPPAGDFLTVHTSNGYDASFETPNFLGCQQNFKCGDANGDAAVDISDVVYLIAYIFSGGAPPSPLLAGDANCDHAVDISDVVYLIAYIFSGGSKPCAVCR
jgi:hypothetical protein